MDAQELKATLLDLKSRLEDIKVNVFQIEDKKRRLEEIENELSQEKVWSDLELSQKLSKEKTNLQKIISKYETVDQKVSDSEVLIDISIEEKDDSKSTVNSSTSSTIRGNSYCTILASSL